MSTRTAGRVVVEHVAVLFGGRSSERDVSLVSGRAVLDALGERAAQEEGLLHVHSIEILTDGTWLVEGRALEPLEALRTLPADALFFLALHGGEGENGTLQAFLEVCGRRHTGSGVAASAICMDKHVARLVLAEGGLCTAPGLRVLPEEWREDRAPVGRALELVPGDAWFVKPNSGGSSLGTRFVGERAGLADAVTAVLAQGDAALVEARVEGIEATCAVMGNRGRALRALTPVEIRPRAGGFFDYREKYDEAGAIEVCPPETLSEATCERLRVLALRAHRLTGCDGYSRTDFIVPRQAGGEAEPVVLEVNTLPGLTPRSLSPRAAAAEGMDFGALCLEIVRLGVETNREALR